MVPTFAMPYSRFAADYDATVGIPFFEQTKNFFERLVRKHGIKFRSAADIGCGTGLFARYLKISRGINVVGVDQSEPMLRIAQRNCGGTNVVLLRQDIRRLHLAEAVDLITANFDTLNHILMEGDLLRTLKGVAANLNPGGHFIFDVITNCLMFGHSHRYVRRFNESRRLVTQSVRLDPIRKLLSILVSISFPDRRRPIFEKHTERVYSPQEIGGALHEAGFVIRGIYDAATFAPVGRCPQRIVVVAKKRS
jgi:SAM-dependent methyltransferase